MELWEVLAMQSEGLSWRDEVGLDGVGFGVERG